MCAGSPTVGTLSSFLSPPDHEFETDRNPDPSRGGARDTPVDGRDDRDGLQDSAGDGGGPPGRRPGPIGALREADIFLPNRWPGDTGRNAFLFLLGRMKSGVTQERAEAELTALVNDSSIAPAGTLAPAGVLAPNVRALARAVGLQEYGTESVRTLLLILLGAGSF